MSHIAQAAAPTDETQSRKYKIASSGFTVTLIAFLELSELLVPLLMADIWIAELQGRNPFVDHNLSMTQLAWILLGISYVLASLELVVRHRSARRGFTLPLVFLPFGRQLRMAFIGLIAALIVLPKLVVYFLFLSVGVPLMTLSSLLGLHLDGFIDLFDRRLEPLENGVNFLHNLFYYNKIDPLGGAFSSAFSLSTTSWCLIH